MSVDKVVATLNQNGQLSANRILFAGEDDFAAKLTIGQILKAKVLRHHEGSRYMVSFNGQEKVVDSSIPLTPGELIEGRVKSLGKQVELQRVNHLARKLSDPHQGKLTEGIINHAFLSGQSKQLLEIQQFFADRNASLTTAELTLLSGLLPRSAPVNAFMLSALVLKKNGIPLTRESIEEIGKALLRKISDRPASASSALSSLNADFTSVQCTKRRAAFCACSESASCFPINVIVLTIAPQPANWIPLETGKAFMALTIVSSPRAFTNALRQAKSKARKKIQVQPMV